MNTHRLPLLTVLLALYLQGCVSISNQTTAIDQQIPPVQPANAWQLTGKLGFKSPQKAGSVNLNWHQSGADYQLKLSGPLGTGNAKITGNNDHIEMQQGTKTYLGKPEELGLQLLGAPLPVNAMSWWARGLPSPNYPTASNIIIDAQGAPQSFEQAGWQLSFSQFQSIDKHLLPKKVSGQLGDLSFKLVISRWNLSDN